MKKEDEYVCSRLKEERRRLKIGQDAVADECGVSKRTVGRWENDTPIPSNQLQYLSRLGFDVLYVVTGSRSASDLPSAITTPKTFNLSDNSGSYRKSDTRADTRTLDPTKEKDLGLDETDQEHPYRIADPILDHEIGSNMTPEERQWLDWYRQMSPEDRELVEPMARRFAERGKDKQEVG